MGRIKALGTVAAVGMAAILVVLAVRALMGW